MFKRNDIVITMRPIINSDGTRIECGSVLIILYQDSRSLTVKIHDPVTGTEYWMYELSSLKKIA